MTPTETLPAPAALTEPETFAPTSRRAWLRVQEPLQVPVLVPDQPGLVAALIAHACTALALSTSVGTLLVALPALAVAFAQRLVSPGLSTLPLGTMTGPPVTATAALLLFAVGGLTALYIGFCTGNLSRDGQRHQASRAQALGAALPAVVFGATCAPGVAGAAALVLGAGLCTRVALARDGEGTLPRLARGAQLALAPALAWMAYWVAMPVLSRLWMAKGPFPVTEATRYLIAPPGTDGAAWALGNLLAHHGGLSAWAFATIALAPVTLLAAREARRRLPEASGATLALPFVIGLALHVSIWAPSSSWILWWGAHAPEALAALPLAAGFGWVVTLAACAPQLAALAMGLRGRGDRPRRLPGSRSQNLLEDGRA